MNGGSGSGDGSNVSSNGDGAVAITTKTDVYSFVRIMIEVLTGIIIGQPYQLAADFVMCVTLA